ncbi:hypothetical protein J421_5322 (plasmid) [Gemmatirosa kalamazoonensis]|uniref:Uncharacterized protein n=1 Tax=Gemmatirosa kalamazoonensis TaxID=861299 RepID=W0RQW5_9BACT|nr:hypothetical protein [Gemmatirosa kalamazoonensis]AHG92857.1 hypothetical protein J421_5322 [Gemmatirosa kalamazoonensis]
MSFHPEGLPDRSTPDAVLYLLRLANADPHFGGLAIRPALVHWAAELNAQLPEDRRIDPKRDARILEPFCGASAEELGRAAVIAIGACVETPDQKQVRQSRMRGYLMLERYFAWCQGLLEATDRLVGEEGERSSPSDTLAIDLPEYRIGGLLGHWLAALCPVIEGWEELKLADERIDALLASGKEAGHRSTLFRFRHGVFHYQRDPDDPRFADFMDPVGAARLWAIQLLRAFEIFFRRHGEDGYAALHEWGTR